MKVCAPLFRFLCRTLPLAGASLLLATTLSAQAPRTLSYQGQLNDFNGVAVNDGPHMIAVALYESDLDGASLWSETQTVQTVKGSFSLLLGGTNPIPDSIRFDKPLWLGVRVDGANELTPRTPLASAPYALNTTTLNGANGDLVLRGSGGTTVHTEGGVLTITSDTIGRIVRSIESGDPGIVVTNPNGPVTTVGLADTGIGPEKLIDGVITTPKLANASVTVEKLSGAGSTSGQILMSNGGGVVWNSVGLGGGFSLPYTTTTTTSTVSFGINNGGGGGVARFASTATGNSEPVFHALSATMAGGASSADSLAGEAILGELTAASGGAYAAGVRGINRSAGSAGAGVVGYHAGTGTGVYGEAAGGSGIGVQGVGGTAVYGTTINGIGVRGVATGTGKGGVFQVNNNGNASIALEATTNGTNGGAALRAYTSGRGKGALVQIDNTANADTALTVLTSGTGWGIAVEHAGSSGYSAHLSNTNPLNTSPTFYSGNAGTGRAGVVQITNPLNSAVALYVETQGSGNALQARVPSGSSSYAVYSDGNAFKSAGGSAWSIPSDARLKQDVRPFTDGLGVIARIEPVRFRYNGLCGTSSAHEEIGVIAQQIGAVAPYTVEPRSLAVHPEQPGGERMEVMTYNSSALQYVTINAVKELNTTVQQQQATIDRLERELREMRETMQLLLQARSGVGSGDGGPASGGSAGSNVSVGP